MKSLIERRDMEGKMNMASKKTKVNDAYVNYFPIIIYSELLDM